MNATPKELVQEYDLKRIGWTYGDIGILYKLGLLKGERITRKNLILIEENSLLDLLKIRDSILKDQLFNTDAVNGINE